MSPCLRGQDRPSITVLHTGGHKKQKNCTSTSVRNLNGKIPVPVPNLKMRTVDEYVRTTEHEIPVPVRPRAVRTIKGVKGTGTQNWVIIIVLNLVW